MPAGSEKKFKKCHGA
ncbi:SEC-C metal-binding domain-containing protein [Pseudomonas aeruginosa]